MKEIEFREVCFSVPVTDYHENHLGYGFNHPEWPWLRLVAVQMPGWWRVHHYDSGYAIRNAITGATRNSAISKTLAFLQERGEGKVLEACRSSGLDEK